MEPIKNNNEGIFAMATPMKFLAEMSPLAQLSQLSLMNRHWLHCHHRHNWRLEIISTVLTQLWAARVGYHRGKVDPLIPLLKWSHYHNGSYGNFFIGTNQTPPSALGMDGDRDHHWRHSPHRHCRRLWNTHWFHWMCLLEYVKMPSKYAYVRSFFEVSKNSSW